MEPTKAFADIVARPGRWWVPIVLMAMVGIVFVYCYSTHVGWERMIRQTMEANSRVQSLPADQRELAVERGIKFAGISGYTFSVIGGTLAVLIVAGVMLLVMNGLMGTQIRYIQSMAIVAYSFLPGVVAALLGIGVMYLKSPEDFDIRNPLAFNGGAFLGATAPKWLVALATSFDLFTFWTMALMAVGFAATTRKMAWSKAFTGVFLMWVLWVVVKTGWAGLMG